MPECERCGVIFAKHQTVTERRTPSDDFEPNFRQMLLEPQRLYIEQHYRHWYEILLNWEQRNEYSVMDEGKRPVGFVVEQGTGLVPALLRVFTGSHRPFYIAVLSVNFEPILELDRQFFFLFSNMEIKGATGQTIGRVRRRFSLLYREYDLEDRHGHVFARIRSPLFRFWTFPVVDASGRQRAVITKKWSGLGKEYFTDADNFGVDFGDGQWMPEQRAVIFAASIAIDFDFFENNQNR